MSDSDECEFKGGHPPAARAGKMRIIQHKSHNDETKSGKDSEDPKPSGFMSLNGPQKTVTVSGAPVKGNADFPPEAIRHTHEKPVPTHDNRPVQSSKIIQQPRK